MGVDRISEHKQKDRSSTMCGGITTNSPSGANSPRAPTSSVDPDPIIQMPDSPIPATPLANANGRPPSLQKLQGLASNSATTRVMNATHSSKSSPGAATSVEDFGHTKSWLMYDPNEYSKSVPSFSAARLLSPSAHSRRRVVDYSHESQGDKKDHSPTTSPLSSQEQNGTPLFRSLLALSPFSHMFSSGPSTTLSKSQDLSRKRSSPTHYIKKSGSTGTMPDNNRSSRKHSDGSTIGFQRGLRDFHSIIHARPFSPTRSASPPESPLSPPTSLLDTTRFHTSSRNDDSPYGSHAHEQAGSAGSTACYQGDESVGLGYTSRTLNSQKVLDLSRYYNAPSAPLPAGSTTSTPDVHKPRRRRHRNSNMTQSQDESPIPRPLFGALHDPDSDSSGSSSSVEGEPGKMGDSPWRSPSFQSHQHSYSHQHRSLSSGSAALSTVSPPQSPLEKELDNRTLYSFARTRLRRDSSGSASSEGEPVAPVMPWPPIQPIPSSMSSMRRSSSTSSLSSTPSSRRSSMSESDVQEVALPYLNLTLLRQAIETYNSSKPESPPRPSPNLTLKDFKAIHPTSWRFSLDFQENQDNGVTGEEVRHRAGSLNDTVTDDALLQGAFKQADTVDRNTEISGNGAVPLEAYSSTNKDRKENVIPALSDPATAAHDITLASPKIVIQTKESGRTSNIVSPAWSATSSGLYSSEGDSTFLLDSLRAVFSSATALGSSFLMRDREDRSYIGRELSGGVNVGGIDLEALRECYEMMIELKPRTIFAIQVTNSMEILLARMELEMEIHQDCADGLKVWSEEEMRAIIILLMNPFLFDQPYQETLLRRILLIFIAFPDKTKLIQWLSCMDDEGMAQLVTLFKMYLSAHFTPRPIGVTHPAICAVKGLSILYQANDIGTKREQGKRRRAAIQDAKDGKVRADAVETNSTISFKYFYSGVMEALKFKDEYQIWRDGWGKSANEKAFSYFDYPFLLSPTSKSHIMNLDALTQMSAHYEDACVRHALADHAQRLLPESMTASAREFQKGIRSSSSPYLVLELTRGRLVEEAFEQITKKHADLKKPLKVAFVDVGEEGMDQGGVTKEFFQIMVEKVFDSQFGLFKELEEGRSWWFEGMMDGSCHVEMSSKDARVRLVEYELVGILVGLALYNGVILGVRFPSVVYRKLLGWEVELESFIESFPALGNGLEQMLTWKDGDVYDVFMREFEISYEHLGQVTTIPLIPGGQDIPVNNDNREEYVKAYMDHYLHEHIRQEFTAFQRGFEKICGGQALKLLRPEELELLLCGNADLDMRDLEASCLYDDGYSPSHTLIKEFWEIVHQDLSPEQHKQLLVFVTGSDRVPIRGLKDLMFVIQRNGPDSDRLPTALTCFSRLLLPEYSNKVKMKERLVTAIENSNGFGLV
ncbi:hypothetical protein EC991_005642 [Linnemannia zychae]|nr:hypothetical protein EC991_005642 [Linnemannia zychae]